MHGDSLFKVAKKLKSVKPVKMIQHDMFHIQEVRRTNHNDISLARLEK